MAMFLFLGMAMTVFGGIALGAILNGYVLSMLWLWFFVPLLGLPELSLAGAIGIALVVSYVTHQYDVQKKQEETWATLIGLVVVRPSITLFIGWIVQHWV